MRCCPLHIFEPRYREMLVHALAHHRMFCVALLKPHLRGMEFDRRLLPNRNGWSHSRMRRTEATAHRT